MKTLGGPIKQAHFQVQYCKVLYAFYYRSVEADAMSKYNVDGHRYQNRVQAHQLHHITAVVSFSVHSLLTFLDSESRISLATIVYTDLWICMRVTLACSSLKYNLVEQLK